MKFTKLIPFVVFTLVAGAGTAQAQEGRPKNAIKRISHWQLRDQ